MFVIVFVLVFGLGGRDTCLWSGVCVFVCLCARTHVCGRVCVCLCVCVSVCLFVFSLSLSRVCLFGFVH